VQLDVEGTVNRPALLLSRCIYVFVFCIFIYLFIYCVQNLPCKFISVKVYLHKYLSLNILCNVYVGRM